MKITLPVRAFKAVELAMAIQDIRFYLCGARIEHNGIETRVIATDGHRLNICRINHHTADLIDPVQFIIPADMVKNICKAKFNKYMEKNVILTLNGTDILAELMNGSKFIGTAVDGKFPEYQRVIPESFSGEVGQYNQEYITDAMRSAGAWLEFKAWQYCATLQHGGLNCGGIVLDDFIAIIMPTRVNKEAMPVDLTFKDFLMSPVVEKAAA